MVASPCHRKGPDVIASAPGNHAGGHAQEQNRRSNRGGAHFISFLCRCVLSCPGKILPTLVKKPTLRGLCIALPGAHAGPGARSTTTGKSHTGHQGTRFQHHSYKNATRTRILSHARGDLRHALAAHWRCTMTDQTCQLLGVHGHAFVNVRGVPVLSTVRARRRVWSRGAAERRR